MLTSFIVAAPGPFRAPVYVERLNRHFALHNDFEVHQIAVATGAALNEAQMLCDYLLRLGYVVLKQRQYRSKLNWHTDCYVPKLPIQFVADPLFDFFANTPLAARKQFAGEGKR